MLSSSKPTPEITITGAIDAVRIWTTEEIGIPSSTLARTITAANLSRSIQCLRGRGLRRNADGRRGDCRRRHRRRQHRVAPDGCRLPQRAHRGARIAPGQRVHRKKHGRRARAVRHQAQYPDVAVLDSVLRLVRRAAGTAGRISRAGLHVRCHPAEAPRLSADEPGAAEIAGPDPGAHGDARRDRCHRSAIALRRHPRRQLLSDRRLRRSLQRDGGLHYLRLREGRDDLALDRGYWRSITTAQGSWASRPRAGR